MQKANRVFEVLSTSFGVHENKRAEFLEAWKKKRVWHFSGSLKRLGADNATVSGKLKPNPHRWKVVISPESFSISANAIEWGAIQYRANRAIEEILASE